MSQQRSWIVFVVATLVLVLAIVVAGILSQVSSPVFKDAAAVLGIVSFTAIAIERILEGMWTFMGSTLGNVWPLNIISKQLNDQVKSLDAMVSPLYSKVHAALASVPNLTSEQMRAAQKEVEQFQTHIKNLTSQLAPDNQRAQLIALTAQQSLDFLHSKYNSEVLVNVANDAKQVIKGINDFVDSFKDNPGRKLISLYIGMVIGLIVAGVLSLDLLTLVLTAAPGQSLPSYVPVLGVILTGLVMGLGSSPAHEIVEAIKQYKQSRKATSTSLLFREEERDKAYYLEDDRGERVPRKKISLNLEP